MKSPKFPIYTVTLFFVGGMILSPFMKNEGFSIALVVLPLLASLSKKYRNLVYLSFLPMGAIHHQQFYNLPNSHYSHFIDKEDNLLINLTHALKPNYFQFRFYGKVAQVNQHNSKGKILISINKEKLKKTPQTGDQIFTQKRPKQLLTRTNPGGFDYKSYLKKIKIYDQLQLKENDFIIIKNQNTTPLDLIRRWNIQLQEKLNQSQLTTASKNTLKTLLLGKRNALDRELVQAYADAGVIHILAISGLHIGIIMLFLGFVLRPIRLLPKGKWFYILSIILLLWCFALFSGASPSVIRAVTMFSGLAIARYTHRIHSTFHLLIVSFLLLLVIYPPFLYQVGFQMSYLAVLGIIKIHPMLQKIWQPQYLLLQKFWEITTVCLAAQIAVAPLSIFYFHQFPGLFLLSNWVVLPFFGLFLIGSMGTLFIIASDYEIHYLTIVYDKTVSVMNESIIWIARQEAFLFQNMGLSLSALISVYALLIFLYWGIKSKEVKYFVGLASAALLLQTILFLEEWNLSKNNQLWLFYQHDSTIIGHHTFKKLMLYSPQKISQKETFLNDFKNKFPLDTIEVKSFSNTFISKSLQLLVLDKKAIYKIPSIKTTHLFITNDPKVNMDRVLEYLHPKMVFADGSNKPWNIERWKQSCQKRNIPFVNLRTNGAYKIIL